MKKGVLGLAVPLLFIGNAFAEENTNPIDLAYKARLVGEGHSARGDSVFARGLPLTSFGRDRARRDRHSGCGGAADTRTGELASDSDSR